MFAKNERGKVYVEEYLMVIAYNLLSVATIRGKLLNTTHTEERSAPIQIQKFALFDMDRKKINLIPNKSFRY